MTKPRIALAVDTLGWCFHRIAMQIQNRLSDEFEFVIVPYDAHSSIPSCDLCVCFWWHVVPSLDLGLAERTLVCFYDHWSLQSYRSELQKVLDKADAIVVANERMLNDFKDCILPPIWICEDGVDLNLFPQMDLPNQFALGWTGRSGISKTKEGDRDGKGIELLRQVAQRSRTPIYIQDSAKVQLRHEKMAEGFYKRISVYCCASDCEGTPNTVLEAAACGRPVITTDVGIVPRLIHHGVNGYIVPRTVDAFEWAVKAIKQQELDKMAERARASAMLHSWKNKIEYWRECLHACCS